MKYHKVNWNIPEPVFRRFKKEVQRRVEAEGSITGYGFNANIATRALKIGLTKLEKEKLDA